MKDIKQIAVVGAGLMGCGIAQVFASCRDLKVKIFDRYVDEKTILKRIRLNIEVLEDKGVFDKSEVNDQLARVTVCECLDDAVNDADFIIECVHENMELKQNLFLEIDNICKEDVILATNTSVMSITEISSRIKKKERLVGAHFWNPPYLIPLVEVVKSNYTSEKIIEETLSLLTRIGKKPIRVNKDVPGFVANRLQHALWREAISIIERGIADAATVDEAVKMSFGLRLPVLAPIENVDMVGLDLTLSIHNYLLKHLENSTEPSLLLKEKVEKGELGFKSGKGFMNWATEDAEKSCKRLIERLIKEIYS